MKTHYFLLSYPGHGGGDWFLLMCNNHPAGMSVTLEAYKEEQFDFAARGLDRRKHLDQEYMRLLEYRTGKDACIGMLKTEHARVWNWMKTREGRRIQIIRNPFALIGMRMWRKVKAATDCIQKAYGHVPKDDDEMFEGHVMRYAYRFYGQYLKRALSSGRDHWPLVRLEDLNRSVGTDGKYFIRVMEWLTQTPWTQQYVDVIRRDFTPAHGAYGRMVFDENFNVERILVWPHLRWRGRLRTSSEWGEDVSKGSAPWQWENWSEEWRGRYLKHMETLQARLGYNQDHIGSTDPDWELRGRFGEVG